MSSVSVIVPTYQGGNKISRLLDALISQSYKTFEVVIVIDGSTDDTRTIVEKYNKSFSHLKIVEQTNKGRAVARNVGAENAARELLIFFDDDVCPQFDCVEQHVHYHSRLQKAIISGKIMEEPLSESTEDSDFLKFKHYLVKKWNKPFAENEINKINYKSYSFTSANLSLSKDLFNRLLGFDKKLNDSEDFDLSIRALQQGVDIYYIPKIIVEHFAIRTISEYISRRLEYKKQRKYLLSIHPEYKQIAPDFFLQFYPSPFKKAIACVFAYNILWARIIHSKLFMNVFSKKMRFKVYDIIITSSIYTSP